MKMLAISNTNEIRANQGRVFNETKVANSPDNAMLRHFPHLFYEWDFEKNDEIGLDIYKVTKGMGKKAWWICNKGHPHDKKIANKTGAIGCPYCSNNKLLVGFNDMWTTNPKLASLLLNPEDGYRYFQSSKQKVDWKCSGCGSHILNRSIYAINSQGLSCGGCSDGVSYPEKLMFNLLKSLDISFEHDISQNWSNNKRYDFYLPIYDCVIETHGRQHSEKPFDSRSVQEEQKNDKYKRELAINSGVVDYIEIDCLISDLEYIKQSILNSKMSTLFDLSFVDWIDIDKKSTKSLVLVACEMYNNGIKIFEIANELKLNRNAISNYLSKGNELGICSYIPVLRRKVVQLSKDNKLIKIWDSIKEAGDEINKESTQITAVCSGHRKTAGGFKWLYLEDYKLYISGDKIPKSINNLHGCSVGVVKLSKELEFIEEYDSIKTASKEFNLKNAAHISSCCKGKRKTAYGFKWMYTEDYQNMVKGRDSLLV